MPFLDLDRISMFYTDQGAASAPATLLVHGWGGDGGQWAPLLPHLGADRRVIVPDLRGHGASRSQWTDEDWTSGRVRDEDFTPRAHAADLARLLAALDTGPVVAVGHSMGGQVVTALAVEHPAHVRALVVLDPAYGAADDEMARIPAEQAALRRQGPAWAARAVTAAFGPAPAGAAREARLAASTDPRVLAAARDGMYLADGAVGARGPAAAYLARCGVPTLALYSGEAPAAWHRTLGPHHPRSAVEVLAGVGHYAHLERPEAVAGALARWLEGER